MHTSRFLCNEKNVSEAPERRFRSWKAVNSFFCYFRSVGQLTDSVCLPLYINVSSTKDNRLKNLLIIKISKFSSKRRSMTGAKIRVPPIGGRTCCCCRQAAETVLNSFYKKSEKVLWESIILKLKSCGRKYANFESFIKYWKQSTCIFFTFLTLAKWAVLHFKTAHFTFPNESFCRAEWAILRCKMCHFEIEEKYFSIFVRFFYQNNGFRLPRMKK